jgi:hypothetical protein
MDFAFHAVEKERAGKAAKVFFSARCGYSD